MYRARAAAVLQLPLRDAAGPLGGVEADDRGLDLWGHTRSTGSAEHRGRRCMAWAIVHGVCVAVGSTVSLKARRVMRTSFVWPSRWMRPAACASSAASIVGSRRTTCGARSGEIG